MFSDTFRRHRGLALLLLTSLVATQVFVAEDEKKETGAICIAPFHREEPVSIDGRPLPPTADGPLMSWTQAPNASSTFSFRVDRRIEAKVKNREMALILGVPTDRKVKVEVRLDDRPFETFWLNLGAAPENRICLWLYPGYWHWINNGWDEKLGCKCRLDLNNP